MGDSTDVINLNWILVLVTLFSSALSILSLVSEPTNHTRL